MFINYLYRLDDGTILNSNLFLTLNIIFIARLTAIMKFQQNITRHHSNQHIFYVKFVNFFSNL